MKKNITGFSIIEILIWMFIFSLWIISVYAVITSSVRINDYNKHYIISSNLAREQLEILRNNRDYNYAKIQKFDQLNPDPLFTKELVAWVYRVENNFDISANFPFNIEKVQDSYTSSDKEDYRLYFNESEMIYTYDDDSGNNKKTPYIKYLVVSRDENDQIFLVSKVIWESRGIHDFEIKTILTDWKQL